MGWDLGVDRSEQIQGVGCGVQGVGCGVQGVGCGVQGVGCGVQDVGCGEYSDDERGARALNLTSGEPRVAPLISCTHMNR